MTDQVALSTGHCTALWGLLSCAPPDTSAIVAWVKKNPTDINNFLDVERKLTLAHCVMYSTFSRREKQYLIYHLAQLGADTKTADSRGETVDLLGAGRPAIKMVFTAAGGITEEALTLQETEQDDKDGPFFTTAIPAALSTAPSDWSVVPLSDDHPQFLKDCCELMGLGYFDVANIMVSNRYSLRQEDALVLIKTIIGNGIGRYFHKDGQEWIRAQKIELIKKICDKAGKTPKEIIGATPLFTISPPIPDKVADVLDTYNKPLRFIPYVDIPAGALIWGFGVTAYNLLFFTNALKSSLNLHRDLFGVSSSVPLDTVFAIIANILSGADAYSYVLAVGDLPSCRAKAFEWFRPGVSTGVTFLNHAIFYFSYVIASLAPGLAFLKEGTDSPTMWLKFMGVFAGMMGTLVYLHRDSAVLAAKEQTSAGAIRSMAALCGADRRFIFETLMSAGNRAALYGAIAGEFATAFPGIFPPAAATSFTAVAVASGGYMNLWTRGLSARLFAKQRKQLEHVPRVPLAGHLVKYTKSSWMQHFNDTTLLVGSIARVLAMPIFVFALLPIALAAVIIGLIVGAGALPQYYGFMLGPVAKGARYLGVSAAGAVPACATGRVAGTAGITPVMASIQDGGAASPVVLAPNPLGGAASP